MSGLCVLLKLRPLLGLVVSRLRSRTEQEICVFRYTECSSYYSWALAKCIRWSKYCTHHAGPQNNVLAHIMHTSCTHPAGRQNNVLGHIMLTSCTQHAGLQNNVLAHIIVEQVLHTSCTHHACPVAQVAICLGRISSSLRQLCDGSEHHANNEEQNKHQTTNKQSVSCRGVHTCLA